VARSCRGGVNNSRTRIENLQPTKTLQHKEIIAGIGYDPCRGESRNTSSQMDLRTKMTKTTTTTRLTQISKKKNA
jgi:hypothetical protein